LRVHWLPAWYQDIIPEPPNPATSSSELSILATPTQTASLSSQAPILPHVILLVHNLFCTPPNNFGIWKQYLYRPSYDLDAFVSGEDLYRPHTSTIVAKQDQEEQLPVETSVYTNKSTTLVVDWQNSSSPAKSNKEVNRLVHKVILHLDFQLDQLQSFNIMIQPPFLSFFLSFPSLLF